MTRRVFVKRAAVVVVPFFAAASGVDILNAYGGRSYGPGAHCQSVPLRAGPMGEGRSALGCWHPAEVRP